MNERDNPLHVGEVLEDRYRIVSEAATQDIGSSCNAYDMHQDKLVEILFLGRSFGAGPWVRAQDRRFGGERTTLDRIVRAQRSIADLAQPALPPIEHAGLVHGQPYLVHGHVEGRTLASLLLHAGPLDTTAAVDLTIRLCEAIAPAHRAGLVHGGLLPECILVGHDGQITVTDTGLIPALRPSLSPPGQPWGRSPYLSPEQAAGQDAHPTSDVYVVGLLLYQMLAGRLPFGADDGPSLVWQHLNQEPPPLQTLQPRVPPHLAQIVHKTLDKEPAGRYRNAGQLAYVLHSQIVGTLAGAEKQDPAAPQQAQAVQRLLVPPPLPRTIRQGHVYSPETAAWREAPAGVDWMMMALILVALIAVLGLIPLWRAVYRRYAAPPPTPISYHLSKQEISLGLYHATREQVQGRKAPAQIWLGLHRRTFQSAVMDEGPFLPVSVLEGLVRQSPLVRSPVHTGTCCGKIPCWAKKV
ncbi:serine/threonine protein kinase [Chloroflexota bacterium]